VRLQAYRFALDPTPAQERLLGSHCGAARVAFNWGLARVKAVMGQREAEATYGISKEDLTPAVSWSLYSLRREWNRAKGDVAPWWGECSEEAFNTGLDNLARSLKALASPAAGDARARRSGSPGSSPATAAGFWSGSPPGRSAARPDTGVLPRLGRIKLDEDGAGLVAKVEAGTARVISAAAGFERGRWFVSFTVDTQRPVLTPASPGAVVGVDLGIKTLAVLSSGEQIPNPRHSNAGLRKIRRLSRAVSRRVGPYDAVAKKGRPPSNRWRHASAALGKAAGRVADQRKDTIHKLTTALAREVRDHRC
jgi:Probable transposase/Helix-turn-helix domain